MKNTDIFQYDNPVFKKRPVCHTCTDIEKYFEDLVDTIETILWVDEEVLLFKPHELLKILKELAWALRGVKK